MSISAIFILVIVLFLLAYQFYGRFLCRQLGLDNGRTTPAVIINDGVDFVPIRPTLLLPQHFSSIAAAGPIVGPILAGLWFGWLPALLWIVIGNIFIGAAHDFSTLAASVRHGAQSIAEVIKVHVGKRGSFLFLLFVWIALIYVIVAFTDLTASTFVAEKYGGGIATSSMLYLLLSLLMGVVIRSGKIPLSIATAVAIPLIVLIIWGGQQIPITLPEISFLNPAKEWGILILCYCFVASILPMSVLLQPRGFLGGYFLYGSLIIGVIGLFFGGYQIQYPAFVSFQNPKGAFLFPILFTTVACGACSGFHGLVCGGTSSKQLEKEGDAHPVGYGGMLLEGLVAVIALATIMIFARGDAALSKGPTEIYAQGLARFATILGVPVEMAMSFGLLAFATFVYDTLDVATRLGRYIFQELTGWQNQKGSVVATLATLALPLFFLITAKEAAYLKFWPIFGASNQLLAALSLLGISVWLIKTGRNPWYTLAPMIFILIVTLWALILFITPWRVTFRPDMNGFVALILICITLFLLLEAYQTVTLYKSKD
ncbi:MAG: carbon starvation protein A [Nitrospirae bacterium]|nr:carbon starvation protein A [Candidatus Troglogloeales bacterium]MBI3598956.1 carbon starvation protein A [Candidatus Troglogloeales bacterium]